MFDEKQLRAVITLQNGQFSGGGNSITLSGLRMTLEATRLPGESGSTIEMLAIYGMSLSHMNQASVCGRTWNTGQQKNTIAVYAGSSSTGGPTNLVASVYIIDALVDASAMPEVCFRVDGNQTHVVARDATAKPTTRKGDAQGADLLSFLAKQMGFEFENNGVSGVLRNPYLHGTYLTQLRKLTDSLGCHYIVENGTLAVWPKGGSRGTWSGGVIKPPQIIGYPSFSQSHLHLTTEYLPGLKTGEEIQVQSSLTPACGTWRVDTIKYELDALQPRGRWQQTMDCTFPDQSADSAPYDTGAN